MAVVNERAVVSVFSMLERPVIRLPKVLGGLTFDQQIQKLFANGEQGFAYDPNDLSTLYQDAAGTVPVTDVGQPVGLIKDKSGRNNHAYQTVSASRPTLSSRVNMLTGTDTLANWSFVNTIKDGNAIKATGTSSLHHITHRTFNYVPSSMITYYVEVTKGTGFCFFQLCYSHMNRVKCTINLATGENSVKKLSTNTTNVVVEDGGDVWRLTLTGSASGTSGTAYANMGFATSLKGDIYNTYDEPLFLANGSERMTIKAIDVRETHIGSNLPKYQRVTSSTDYDSVGFPNYLVFDGVDDFLRTDNIDFTGTDKVSLFVGLRKLSDVSIASVFCLTATPTTTQGTFEVYTPHTTGGEGVVYYSRGATIKSTLIQQGLKSPSSFILSAKTDISSSSTTVKINSSIAPSTGTGLGGGYFGNHPLYVGRRGGNSLPFNGHIYGLIGIGKLTSDTETIVIEKEIAKRVGVTLNV